MPFTTRSNAPLGRVLTLATCLAAALGAASHAPAQGLVYVDANDGFTGTQTLFPTSALNLELAEPDNLWGFRDNLGAEGVGGRFIYESGGTDTGSGVEDSPEIFQTISGLTPSTSYDLYAAYWSPTGQNWAIRTGTSSGDLTLYDRTGELEGATAGVGAGSVVWAAPPTSGGAPIFAEADRVMLLGFAGTVMVGASGEANVYFDDLPNTGFADRSWIDGVAYAPSGSAISLTAMIDRNTGVLTLSNNTGAAFDFAGMTISSASGALDASAWLSITDNHDTGALDTDPWEVTAPEGSPTFTGTLSEVESAGGSGAATLANGQSVSFGGVWNDTRFQDVSIQLTLPNEGGAITVTPTYTGLEHLLGDFNNDGAVNLTDYFLFSDNLHTDVSGLTQAEAYLHGDMNGDLLVDHSDFVAFRGAFPGSLEAALAAIPEPASAVLGSLSVLAAFGWSRRRRPTRQAAPQDERPFTNQHPLPSTTTMPRTFLLAGLTAAALLATNAPLRAADVTLNAEDAFGTSSLNSVGNWSNGAAPSAGNDYFVTGPLYMRTPADDASYTFAGDSLTIRNSGDYPNGILLKGTGTTGVVTIPNLILDGGRISHAQGTTDLMQIDGAIQVVSDSVLYAKQGTIDILSSISGAGNLTLQSTDAPGETNARFVNLLGASTLAGDITVAAGAKLGLGATGSLSFSIGASGVNNTVAGDGIANFNGAFNLDLGSASTTLGDSWQLTDVTTQTFGDDFSVSGFTGLGDVWFDGTYVFDETTGALEVAPTPERLTLRVLSNGQIQIVNENVTGGSEFNYYEIRSASGALDAAWAGIDGDATPSDTSWETAGGSSANLIAETNLLGSQSLSLGNSVSLGQAYTGAAPEDQDLMFFYGLPGDDTLLQGFVEYVSGGLDGDYNNDGVVDAADYTVWRDGNSPDSSQAGYQLWRDNYGATLSAPSAAGAAPEPACCVLAAFAVGLLTPARRPR